MSPTYEVRQTYDGRCWYVVDAETGRMVQESMTADREHAERLARQLNAALCY